MDKTKNAMSLGPQEGTISIYKLFPVMAERSGGAAGGLAAAVYPLGR